MEDKKEKKDYKKMLVPAAIIIAVAALSFGICFFLFRKEKAMPGASDGMGGGGGGGFGGSMPPMGPPLNLPHTAVTVPAVPTIRNMKEPGRVALADKLKAVADKIKIKPGTVTTTTNSGNTSNTVLTNSGATVQDGTTNLKLNINRTATVANRAFGDTGCCNNKYL